MTLQEETLVWRGTGASAGIVTGTARILYTEKDFINVDPQDILVARHATPDLYPSLVRAKAVICETGGRLCHLAILARELGKPCVTGLPKILDNIKPGARIRVDGSKGTVEVLTFYEKKIASHDVQQTETPSLDFFPVIQFGLFSKTFEYVGEQFDIETIVRAAAFVSLPIAFNVGSSWEFTVSKNQILVSRSKLLSTKSIIIEQIESGMVKFDNLHQKYFDVCTWGGWIDISSQDYDATLLESAFDKYVFINQMTWLACLVKEELTERYRKFLAEKLPELSEETLNQIFLNTLIMPGHSYILQGHLGNGNQNVWDVNFSQDKPDDVDKTDSTVYSMQMIEDVDLLKANTLEELGFLLDEQSYNRVAFYISTLANLVDVTERKNTDLYKCGKSLFAKVGNFLGFEATGTEVANASIEERKVLIQKVLAKILK